MSARMPISSNMVASKGPQAERAMTPHMASRRHPRAVPGEVRLSVETVRIEGLNLNSRQGAHVKDTVERELGRLLRAQPLQLRGGAMARLSAPSLSASIGTDPEALGVGIARSLFAAMRYEVSGDER